MTIITRRGSGSHGVVVTGAGRGIGHAVATHLLDRGDNVVLGVRRPESPSVRSLAERYGSRAIPVRLDLDEPDSITAAGDEIARSLDSVAALVHCAGINISPSHERSASKGPLPLLVPDAVERMFRINVTGTLRVVQAILPLFDGAGSPTIMNLGTSRGSLALVDDEKSIGYAVTKAALTMLTRKMSFAFAGRAGCVVTVDPGWVRTDMGGEDAPVGADEAGRDLIALLDSLDVRHNGRFLSRTGEEVPW
ncbi:SDR family NAD(P)-dependent oxidoreductase [Pseudonocardia spinosispora]|uniref:SDR family NAD(P)-dependent oxidoreductase n=1 Tax=Pseudonocardia spinosispora TaxID=103441 RepID=UPI0004287E62|nr:SDR family NAD(P)-dependent oxidoreductase [Pseudonocardia spinosispora]